MSWIRDLFGIKKDIEETKKTKLEIEKLENEMEEKESIIQKPTFEQIKEYDPKIGIIEVIKKRGIIITLLIIGIMGFLLNIIHESDIIKILIEIFNAIKELFK